MTNKEKWMAYTSSLPSPESYIVWGWRFVIAASLQRRVWCPPKHRPCYPNMYPIMVGGPGLGKGQVIKAVGEILRFHKLEVGKPVAGSTLSQEEQQLASEIAEADLKTAQENDHNKSKSSIVDKPLLIPMAPNATSYQALVSHMSKCLRRINYNEDGKLKIYSHSSLCFCLEEMASLFRKHQDDTLNFLLETYDCNETYEYETIGRGKDRIRRVCLNLFGGTTPDFMQRTFDDGLLNQGFSSRAFFIYASKKRQTVFFMDELTIEQKKYQTEIIAHVKGLTQLYGQVEIDEPTKKFLLEWLTDFESSTKKRASQSRKMDSYYARMAIHLMKVAMANHFGESYEMYIPQWRFEEAIEDLRKEEKTMHLALTIDSDNKLSKIAAKILDYLDKSGRQTFTEILVEFFGMGNQEEIKESLDYLQEAGQVIKRTDKDEHTGENETYYLIKEQ